MLTNPINLIRKYTKWPIDGVIHIGVYVGEELSIYEEAKIPPNRIIMIEGNPSLYEELVKNVGDRAITFNSVISDKCGPADFHLIYSDDNTNKGCSSLLTLGKHAELYPMCKEVGKIKVETTTLDSLLLSYYLDPINFNFLNMDVQGAELMVLKGSPICLRGFDFIYTEFSKVPLYNEGTDLDKLDEFLYDDFVNVERVYAHEVWGDCLYIKRDLLDAQKRN